MQRVLQRAARARRVADKKKAKLTEQSRKMDEFELKNRRSNLKKEIGRREQAARIRMREDWEMGPLAPRRDVGPAAESYGTLPIYGWNLPPRLPRDRPKMLHLAQGDRVAIVHGRHKGKIGVINNILEEEGAVQLKDELMVDIRVPQWMNHAERGRVEESIVPIATPIAIENVRLVWPLKDKETGLVQDRIIEELDIVWQRNGLDEEGKEVHKKEPRKRRVISGTNTIIPWPLLSDPEPEKEYDIDTKAADVQSNTYDYPSLLYSPMPFGVIDELRNKYSRFRTRHDYDYVAAKEAEEAKAETRKNLIHTMKTPQQRIAELKTEQKAAKLREEMSEEDLAKLGALIAAAQAGKVDDLTSGVAKL